MGYVDYNQAQFPLQLTQLLLEALPQGEVQGGKWFIEQEYPGFDGQGSGNGYALPLAAGQFVGAVSCQVGQAHPVQKLMAALMAVFPPRSGIGYVLQGRHVRKEGVVLEYVADAAAARWQIATRTVSMAAKEEFSVEADFAGVRMVEAGDCIEGGALAGTRWAIENENLSGHLEPDIQGKSTQAFFDIDIEAVAIFVMHGSALRPLERPLQHAGRVPGGERTTNS